MVQSLEILKRRLAREQKARREAEAILETKSRELYLANERLRRVTRKLSVQHRRILSMVTSASDGILTLSIEGEILSHNPAVDTIFDRQRSLIGMSFVDLFEPESQLVLQRLFPWQDNIEFDAMECHCRTSAGELRVLEISWGDADIQVGVPLVPWFAIGRR